MENNRQTLPSFGAKCKGPDPGVQNVSRTKRRGSHSFPPTEGLSPCKEDGMEQGRGHRSAVPWARNASVACLWKGFAILYGKDLVSGRQLMLRLCPEPNSDRSRAVGILFLLSQAPLPYLLLWDPHTNNNNPRSQTTRAAIIICLVHQHVWPQGQSLQGYLLRSILKEHWC